MQEHEVPRPFYLVTIAAFISTCLLVTAVAGRFALDMDAFIALIAVVAAVSESFAPIVGGYSASLTFPLMMSAMLLGGPLAAGVVAGVSALGPGSFSSRKGFVTTVYNIAQHTSVAVAGGWLYRALEGTQVPFRSGDFPVVLVPLLVTAGVCALGNMVLTAFGVSVLYRETVRSVLPSVLRYGPSLLALAAVGYLMAQVMAVSVFGLPLFVFPLWIARQLYQSFVHLQDAYTDTLRSLVRVLEAKDPYTHGHSERVAGFAVSLANCMKLDPDMVKRIEHAGLLHDVGKVAIPGDLLRKPSGLTAEERRVISDHPLNGASMISRITTLRDLAPSVMQHHERIDGGGYPMSISGNDICLEARILAIADCFDAMTTDRPYRPALSIQDAVDELIANSGTQFDEQLVGVFIGTLFEETVIAERSLQSGHEIAAETA